MTTQPTTRLAVFGPSDRIGAWRAEARATFALTVPMVLTQLAQMAMLVTDTLMIGRLGELALASASLGFIVFFNIFSAGMGVVMGTAPLASQAHGARQPRIVRRVVRQGLWWVAALALPTCTALAFTGEMLVALGQPAAAAAGAHSYMSALLWSLPTGLGYIVLRNFVSALHRPRPALWVALAAIPLNALLDYALIFGEFGAPRLELFGAGLATTAVNALMFAVMLAVALKGRPFRRYHLLGRFWRPDGPIFRRIFAIGLPIAALLLMEGGIFGAATIMMGWIGTTAIAAHQIALQVAAVAFMVPLGIGQAATVRVGHAVGRRDAVGSRRAGWVAIAMGIGFMSMSALVIWSAPGFFARLYLDPSMPGSAAVIVLASELLVVAALFQVVDGAQTVGSGVLRGLSDTRVPMLFAAVGYWGIGFSTAYALGFVFGYGPVGVWIGLAIALGIVAVMMLLRWWRLTRRGYLPTLTGVDV